jgi:hypothetical protein
VAGGAGATRQLIESSAPQQRLCGTSPKAIEKHSRASVRLAVESGKPLELKHIRVASDSLVGVNLIGPSKRGMPKPRDRLDTVAVALTDISRMGIETVLGTAAGILGGVALLVVIVVVAVSQAADEADMGGF